MPRKWDKKMSKLSKEIKENNAYVKLASNERSSREALVNSIVPEKLIMDNLGIKS